MRISKVLSYSSALVIRSLGRGSTAAFQIVGTNSYSTPPRIKSAASSFHSVPYLHASHHPLSPITATSNKLNINKRQFFSQRNNASDEDSKDKSILQKAKDKVKNVIPSFLKPKSMLTKREKTRQDAQDNISSSIDTMLKDAPLGVRMMGKMISPLVSSVAGGLAEAMEEQSRQMNDLLDDARMYILSDSFAIDILGEPIEVGVPFSQSSSSINVNGRASSRINASFEVRGSRGGGVATMDATDGKLQRLTLNSNGRNLNINLTKGASPNKASVGSSSSKRTSGIGKNRVFNDDEIIDAEFVEKKVDK